MSNKKKSLADSQGACEPYLGSVCSKYIGHDYVYITEGFSQSYIEQKLQSAFSMISSYPGEKQYNA